MLNWKYFWVSLKTMVVLVLFIHLTYSNGWTCIDDLHTWHTKSPLIYYYFVPLAPSLPTCFAFVWVRAVDYMPSHHELWVAWDWSSRYKHKLSHATSDTCRAMEWIWATCRFGCPIIGRTLVMCMSWHQRITKFHISNPSIQLAIIIKLLSFI